MDVSILTVTWNSSEYIIRQMKSVKEAAGEFAVEQLIADNHSTDGTVAPVLQKFPDAKLKVFDTNLGFSRANNFLSKQASGKYFLLLNPDVELEANSLSELVKFIDQNPKIGIVGGLLVTKNGEVKKDSLPRRFPKIFDQALIVLKIGRFFPSLLNKYQPANFDISVPQKVDSVQGAAMLVRKELVEKIGNLLDERFYIWFEDVDLCREAVKQGYEVWFYPEAKAVDFGGRSFAKQRFFWKQKEFIRSLIKYFWKWNERFSAALIFLLAPLVIIVAWVYDLSHDYEA